MNVKVSRTAHKSGRGYAVYVDGTQAGFIRYTDGEWNGAAWGGIHLSTLVVLSGSWRNKQEAAECVAARFLDECGE